MNSTSRPEPVRTDMAPQAIGPYSQAVVFNGLLFASGQIGLDPASGQMAGSDVETQTRRVLENVRGILQSRGLGVDRVVKTTIFLKNMADFQTVNTLYGGFFKEPYPARSTVEAARLPKDALVEIDFIAAL